MMMRWAGGGGGAEDGDEKRGKKKQVRTRTQTTGVRWDGAKADTENKKKTKQTREWCAEDGSDGMGGIGRARRTWWRVKWFGLSSFFFFFMFVCGLFVMAHRRSHCAIPWAVGKGAVRL